MQREEYNIIHHIQAPKYNVIFTFKYDNLAGISFYLHIRVNGNCSTNITITFYGMEAENVMSIISGKNISCMYKKHIYISLYMGAD
jgi:hypothetical protein